MKKIWVNIYDFIDDISAGRPVRRFQTQRELADYTIRHKRIYPKRKAKEGGPARAMLAQTFQ